MYRGRKAYEFVTAAVDVVNRHLAAADQLVARRKGAWYAVRRLSDPPVRAVLDGFRAQVLDAAPVPGTSVVGASIHGTPRHGIGSLIPLRLHRAAVAAGNDALEMFSIVANRTEDDAGVWPEPGATPASYVAGPSLHLVYRLSDGSSWELGSLPLDLLR